MWPRVRKQIRETFNYVHVLETLNNDAAVDTEKSAANLCERCKIAIYEMEEEQIQIQAMAVDICILYSRLGQT